MKIPRKLKIGSHLYRVFLVPGDEIDQDCGEVDCGRNTIKIRKDMPQTRQEETLLHEMIHALNRDVRDDIVNFYSEAIYQVLKDNHLLKT